MLVVGTLNPLMSNEMSEKLLVGHHLVGGRVGHNVMGPECVGVKWNVRTVAGRTKCSC